MFHHDCRTCTFLGNVVINGKAADIYVCENDRYDKTRHDLLWRHSNEPSDYGSMWVSMCSPLSPWSMVALALYVEYLGANGANGLVKGQFYKDNELVLNLP